MRTPPQPGRGEPKPENHAHLVGAEARSSKLNQCSKTNSRAGQSFRARYPAMINSFSEGIFAICCLSIFMWAVTASGGKRLIQLFTETSTN